MHGLEVFAEEASDHLRLIQPLLVGLAHLVIVRYTTWHNALQEWVYDRADIDDAKTVWAREIPGVSMQPLLDYFRGRDVWLVEPDRGLVPRLLPYSSQDISGARHGTPDAAH